MVSIIVCGFAKPFSNEVAAVKILNVDPNSYNPCAALLNNGLSEGSPEIATLGLLFGSKSGNETKEIISPVFTYVRERLAWCPTCEVGMARAMRG